MANWLMFFPFNPKNIFNLSNIFEPFSHSQNFPSEIQSVTLNDRRNNRLSFVKENKYKVGLNLVKNRLHSVTNIVDKKWIDLSLERYKLECKKRIIQNSLLSLWLFCFLFLNYVIVPDSLKMCYVYIHICNCNE
jgi:hypothetical protein